MLDFLDESDYMYIRQYLKERGAKI